MRTWNKLSRRHIEGNLMVDRALDMKGNAVPVSRNRTMDVANEEVIRLARTHHDGELIVRIA